MIYKLDLGVEGESEKGGICEGGEVLGMGWDRMGEVERGGGVFRLGKDILSYHNDRTCGFFVARSIELGLCRWKSKTSPFWVFVEERIKAGGRRRYDLVGI